MSHHWWTLSSGLESIICQNLNRYTTDNDPLFRLGDCPSRLFFFFFFVGSEPFFLEVGPWLQDCFAGLPSGQTYMLVPASVLFTITAEVVFQVVLLYGQYCLF